MSEFKDERKNFFKAQNDAELIVDKNSNESLRTQPQIAQTVLI